MTAAAFSTAACSGAQLRGSGGDSHPSEMAELHGQLKAQSALLAEQQRRIEQLEVRLAAMAARLSDKSKPVQAADKPASAEPALIQYDGRSVDNGVQKKLKTVKMEAPKGRRLRRNPSERAAPALPTVTNLKEPQEADLDRLDDQPAVRPSRAPAYDPGRENA